MEALVNKYFDGHPETRLENEAVEESLLIEFMHRAKEEEKLLLAPCSGA